MKRVGHALQDLLQPDHLTEEPFDIPSHDMLLASGNGVWAVLEGCYMRSQLLHL